MILVSHPVGNQNVRALIRTLDSEGRLHSFHTSIAFDNSSKIARIIPLPLRRQLERRSFDEIGSHKINTFPLFDSARLIAQRLKIKKLVDNKSGLLRPQNLYRSFDNKVAGYIEGLKDDRLSAVYGYDGKCLRTFKAARKKGAKLYYEAAFGYAPYVSEVLEDERRLKPEWSSSIPVLSKEVLELQKKEVELADHIIVASQFAYRSFLEAGVDKDISIVPYGAPASLDCEQVNVTKNSSSLKVAFIGALSQQKGLSYLLDAMELVGESDIELTLIGQDYSNGENRSLKVGLENHFWKGAISHSSVLDTLAEMDVLVLPSIAEAFGLVVLEALSRGVVVVITENCGASDAVIDGRNGFIVPIRCASGIADKLQLLANNRKRLLEMQLFAKQSIKTWGWDNYSASLLKVL